MEMNRRLKVLVSAYACSPYKGSEPGVGWGVVAALSAYHDIWVIVEDEKFRLDIEKYLEQHPKFAEHVSFFYIHKQRNRWLRKIWPPSYYWYYKRWHKDAFELAQKLHTEVGFDLAHQLTMVGFREPGYLWKIGIPFVWGPIGGMGYFPYRFLPVVGLKGAIHYLAYNTINCIQSHFLKRPRLAAKHAGPGLITATPENKVGAQNLWKSESTVISEVGLPPHLSTNITVRKEKEPLKLVWVGQHTPGKALGLALSAIQLLDKTVEWELHILGKGKMTENWQRFARKKGIHDKCHFHGWLQRNEALAVMKSSHVQLITSLRDLTSTVTVEALALGLPVICLDHCGFSHAITPECGIKIPVTTPKQVIANIAESIEKISEDEIWRQKLAAGALLRAGLFSWERKVRQLNSIYERVVTDK